MACFTRSAAKTVSNVSDIDGSLLSELHKMMRLIKDDRVDRVVVELRVKQVIDEEAPKDS
tara:strand:- start:222 stop:401 length:180 start_codon:yes stop_codon:yes gene_type:complete